jgi:hypothetical protein
MHIKHRLFVVLTSAVVLFVLASGTSTALRSISINEKSVHLTYAALSFTEPVFGLSVACPVTLTVVFNEHHIAKTGTEIGNVTEILYSESSCRGGTARPLPTTPWVVLYNGFTGTLPEIRTVRFIIRRSDILYRSLGGECLYEGAFEGIATLTAGEITSVEMVETRNVGLSRTLAGSCARTARFRGRATVVRLCDERTGVTMTLE